MDAQSSYETLNWRLSLSCWILWAGDSFACSFVHSRYAKIYASYLQAAAHTAKAMMRRAYPKVHGPLRGTDQALRWVTMPQST